MKQRKTTGEVFLELKNAKNKKERVDILKKNDTLALRSLLRLQFDDRFKFSLPKGTPKDLKKPHIPNGLGETTIMKEVKRLYIFLEGQAPTVKPEKKEKIFLDFLLSLDSSESDIMIAVKDKLLTNYGVTRKIVEEAFPALLPTVISKKDEKEATQSNS